MTENFTELSAIPKPLNDIVSSVLLEHIYKALNKFYKRVL